MKTLSIKEPWISLILSGRKCIETRTWNTNYRGDILLVGSRNPKGPCSGLAVAIVNLDGVWPMKQEDKRDALCEVYPRAKSWHISNLRKIKTPFPVKGKLSLYETQLPEDIELIETVSTAKIFPEHMDILNHTRHRAANRMYCGDSKEMQDLIKLGFMKHAGEKYYVPEPYFTITKEGTKYLNNWI